VALTDVTFEIAIEAIEKVASLVRLTHNLDQFCLLQRK
jgi:hypothetical protein